MMFGRGYEYSEKEVALLGHYFTRVEEMLSSSSMAPVMIFPMAGIKAFVSNENDEVFDASLRRCIEALNNCKPYRDTPEWEALIDNRVLG